MIKIGETIPSIGGREYRRLDSVELVLENIDHQVIDIESEENPTRIYRFPNEYKSAPQLAQGYFFKGGVARCALLNMIGLDFPPPRDIDVVAIEDYSPDLTMMKEYEESEYDVEKETFRNYFQSRDFTINEVLTDEKYIFCTEQALQDAIDKTVRPSRYEKEFRHGRIKHKLVLKALRILSEFELMYNEGRIEDIEGWQFKMENLSLFSVALALDKACEMGEKVAGMFLVKLIEAGLVEVESGNSRVCRGRNTTELAVDIAIKMIDEGDSFAFRSQKLREVTDLLMTEPENIPPDTTTKWDL